jgi:aspartyl-tRNA(Asn)/glutamyl-tRNA(Gln) amidotransferase subunit A
MVAWNLGEKFDDPIAMYLADIYTTFANICGLPGISVPCGLSQNLPVGLQFVSPRMEDCKLLDNAAAYEAIRS